MVLYKPLHESQLHEIIGLLMRDLEKRLEERRIKLTLTEAAKDFIIRQAYEPAYGARPLKRYLQKTVETMLAKAIIAGEIQDEDHLEIGYQNEQLHLSKM